MKQTSRIIWKADKKLSEKGTIGYLYLSTRVAKKQILKGIDLPRIEKKYWLKKNARVSESFPSFDIWSAEKINEKIEIKLREASLAHHDFKYISDEKKSLIEYYNQQILLTNNHGTKMKYENVRNLLLEFAKEELKIVDIKFQDVTPVFIKKFFQYLRIEKKNQHNTVQYKIKSFQAMINRAVKEGVYYYPKSPFDSYEYDFEDTMIKEILSLDELDRLFNTEFYEVYRGIKKFGQKIPENVLNDVRYKHSISLQDYRNFWLFQLFAQGMRVSDLLTLRWNDFKTDENKSTDIRIIKRMIKTKAFVTVYLNDKLIDILTPYVERFLSGQKETESYKRLVTITNEIQRLKTSELKESRYNKGLSKINASTRRYARFTKDTLQENNPEFIANLKTLMNRKRIIVKSAITFLSTEFKTSFVFGILKDSDFRDINDRNDFGTMSKIQYTRLSGARVYYNRLLKCISEQAGIDKNLTTHLARHSYTSLMIEMGEEINLFDVMNSLGHKHLSTTQTYLQKFTNKKLDNLNRILSDKLESKWSLNKEGKAYNPIQKPL